ncbi:MAG: SH3 domain-containing protein [Acetatifactor sp.]|nr:SH3 domain-containing protein [Acetatifactor sp.]
MKFVIEEVVFQRERLSDMRNRFRKIKMLSAGLVLCLAFQPMTAFAAERDGILQAAGVASIMDVSKTQEEYLISAEEAQGALWGYTNIGIAEVESGNLNVRAAAGTDAKLVGKLPKNAVCEVLESADGWAHIQSGEVDGYVSLDFLLTGPEAVIKARNLVRTVAIAQTNGLNVREQPNTSSAVLTQVLKGEELEFVENLEDGWVKVSIDGEDAYVSGEFVSVEDKLDTAITMSELLYGQGVSDVRVDLVEYAKQFLGNPYVWGGTSLTKGADCSGFVLSVFKHYGIKLSHHSGTQAKEGTKISASDLLPGDLVFYGNGSGTINHVAIYIGGGRVIHASSPKTGIKISNYKYRTPVKYVRVLYD